MTAITRNPRTCPHALRDLGRSCSRVRGACLCGLRRSEAALEAARQMELAKRPPAPPTHKPCSRCGEVKPNDRAHFTMKRGARLGGPPRTTDTCWVCIKAVMAIGQQNRWRNR